MRLTARRAMSIIIENAIAAGEIASAGRCMARGVPGHRLWTSYHDEAPQGVSWCRVCGRRVLRGFGTWWDAP